MKREREREFYLMPMRPGCGHMAADVKKQRSWAQHVAQTIGRVYVQAAEGRSVYDTC